MERRRFLTVLAAAVPVAGSPQPSHEPLPVLRRDALGGRARGGSRRAAAAAPVPARPPATRPGCPGDFDRQEPTPDPLEALGRLVAAECAARDIPLATLGAHRDHEMTWCPVGSLNARLEDVRGRSEELFAAGAPKLARQCGGEGAARIAAIEAGT